ncbi:MAG: hypothetical protein ACTSPB_01685 [Candidatus Thorarchaeota archaeon]|nr:MAG: hypothetical protein DRO54_04825 [Candidatus Bathyarchaeota archaeon]RLI55400.1 MAG: hypothetical protein DRP09_09895 [Candidatus Thorarchaeota archaeon]
MTYEVQMRINGSSSSIKPSENHAGVGGLTDDLYDMMVTSIERRQDAHLGVPNAPNLYYDEYEQVDYMGYANPRYSIRGVIDEIAAEQLLTSDVSGGQTVQVADGTKFESGDKIYLWDEDSDGEAKTVQSVTKTSVTFTTTISGTYTTAKNARIRARNRVGRRILQYFLENKTDKVLIDPHLCPDGVTVQIESITITKESTSISPAKSSDVPDIGAVMEYDMTLVETPTGVTS